MRLTLFLTLCVLLTGCETGSEISRYTVPHEPRDRSLPRDDLMISALLLRDNQAWFFKLVGPHNAAKSARPAFEAFLQEIDWKSGEPKWNLPEGWGTGANNGRERFATVLMPSENGPKLEIAVSRLPVTSNDPDAYVAMNVNRWRRQMGLGAWTQDEAVKRATLVSVADSQYRVFALRGEFSGGPSSMGSTSPVAQNPAPSAQSTFVPPEGWKPIPAKTFGLAAFEVVADGERVEITISELRGDSGSTLANVNRWRGQIQLEAVGEAELASMARPISAGSIQGTLVEFAAPVGSGAKAALMGAILPRGASTVYVKMIGSDALVQRERKNFESFVTKLPLGSS